MHRIVIDGGRPVVAGGRGAQVIAVTTPKGWRRPTRQRAELVGQGGRFAEQIDAGTLIDGQRVVDMRRGTQGGRTYIVARLADGRWTGRLYFGERVPGTRVRTDMPAGPVGAGRGKKATRVAWNEGESRTDRNARRIDAIIYG